MLDNLIVTLTDLLKTSGFSSEYVLNYIMIGVAFVLFYLAIKNHKKTHKQRNDFSDWFYHNKFSSLKTNNTENNVLLYLWMILLLSKVIILFIF